jgi:hypothetical protein
MRIKGKEGQTRGEKSEEKILNLLIKSPLPSWVTGPIWRTNHSDRDDEKGIDIWIQTIKGRIPLQVKTKKDKNRTRSFYSNKGVAYIACNTNAGYEKSDDHLYYELLREIQNYFLP